mgnify:CR=1 FL=1
MKHALFGAMVAAALAVPAFANDYTIMAPASPGGGWDSTARTMQEVMQAEGISGSVQVTNVPGAGGTVGLAQFVASASGDPSQLIVGGYVMVGAILTNASPVSLADVTPIARLTGEAVAIVVPAASEIQDIKGLVDAMAADPGAVSWAGGSAGGVDHITVGLLAKAAGVSNPTVVRLCQKLGYKGYPDYQQALRGEVEAMLVSPLVKHDRWAGGVPDTHILNRFADAVVANLQATLGQIDHAEFDAAAALLADMQDCMVNLDIGVLYLVCNHVQDMLALILFGHHPVQMV